jgi:hypothetical protein
MSRSGCGGWTLAQIRRSDNVAAAARSNAAIFRTRSAIDAGNLHNAVDGNAFEAG